MKRSRRFLVHVQSTRRWHSITPGSTTGSASLVSDDIDLPTIYTESTNPQSTFIEQVLGFGPFIHHVGANFAPLDIKYIISAKTVGWRTYASWLSAQRDLSVVIDNSSLEVWRNDSQLVAVGRRTTSEVESRSG